MSTSNIFSTEQKPLWWADERYSHVRIEVDLTHPWIPMQRHIWTYHDGKEWVEDWIKSLPNTTAEKLLGRGWKHVSHSA